MEPAERLLQTVFRLEKHGTGMRGKDAHDKDLNASICSRGTACFSIFSSPENRLRSASR